MMLINRSGSLILTFLSLYLTQELDMSKLNAGIVISCYGVGSLAGSFLGGWLADKFGNFKVMFFSLIFGGASLFGMLYITEFYQICFWIFICATILDTLRPALWAEVGQRSEDANVTRAVSLIRMALNLGVFIGPAVGGFIAYHYGYDWLFIIDGVTCICAGIFLWFMLNPMKDEAKIMEKEKPKVKGKNPYLDFHYVVFLFFNLIALSAFFQIIFVIPVYFKEVFGLNEDMVGWFLAANGLIIFIFEMPIIYYIEKTKATFKPMIIGYSMIGISFIVLLAVVHPLTAIVFFLIFNCFGEIISFPFISTISIRRADDASLGNYMGATTVLFSLAIIISPLIGLPVVEVLGYDNYWIFSFVIVMIGVFGIRWTQTKFEMGVDNV